ncbi:MAG: hypothetical protein NTW26_06765 [bacterium]|nr:hypothetical protein [bacterium]
MGFDPKETTAKDVIAACLTRLTVRDLTITEPKIESIVRHIYDDRADNYSHAAEPTAQTAGRHAGRRRRI